MHIIVALISWRSAVPLPRRRLAQWLSERLPAEARQKLAKVQIPFIANQGQSDKEVKFYARTFAGTVFVTETGKLVYSLPKVEEKKQIKGWCSKKNSSVGR